MVHKFKEFVALHSLFISSKHKVLLAVSGGMDSMCMLDLFQENNLNFGVAHCNFSLRNLESDQDEEFVREFCVRKNIRFYSVKFDTSAYAQKNKISIQMAARDLRYEWLEDIRKSNGYDYIAIAHHKNDEIETFFINLIRGTGIAGLTGISLVNEKVIRPLLFATRQDIVEYVTRNNIPFREDSSNAETKYLRNKIRHNIIPQFEELNPSFQVEMHNTMSGLKLVYEEFKKNVNEKRNSIILKNGENIKLSIKKLKEFSSPEIILFELLKEYGFNKDNVTKICHALDVDSGKLFYSTKYKLLKDREFLVVNPIKNSEDSKEYLISENDKIIQHPEKISINYFDIDKIVILKNKNNAFIDFSKLEFPLKIRRWKKGDSFYPFGMKGKKLLSDYFIDNKFSIFDKENAWVLCSGNDIVWIIGHRIDDRYRISNDTTKVCVLELMV